jgi:hypothetical protein
MTTSPPNQSGQAPHDPAAEPDSDEVLPNPETDPDALPEPHPEAQEGGQTQPGQMPDHNTEVGA